MHPSHGHDQTIVNGISRIGYMSGGKAARWVDEDMADTFTRKAVGFIEQNKARPFFLYFATHDPHVPRVPHPRFAGKSGCGVRGDVIVQFDWCAGEILNTLDRLKLNKNTLVILSSDNGPVVDDGYRDGAVKTSTATGPPGPLRGGKYSIFEGGTRVPFIARWPGRIKPGVSDALVCHIDFLASFAALTGQKLGAGTGRTASTCCPRCWANPRPAAINWSNMPARLACARHRGNTSSRAPGPERSRHQHRTRHRRRPANLSTWPTTSARQTTSSRSRPTRPGAAEQLKATRRPGPESGPRSNPAGNAEAAHCVPSHAEIGALDKSVGPGAAKAEATFVGAHGQSLAFLNGPCNLARDVNRSNLPQPRSTYPLGYLSVPDHCLLDLEGFNVVVVKEVIESFAVNAVLVVAEVLGARAWIRLVKVAPGGGGQWAIADARPDIADHVLDVGFLRQQDCSRGILHH